MSLCLFGRNYKLDKPKAHVVVNHVTLRFRFIGSQSELKIFLVLVYFGKVTFCERISCSVLTSEPLSLITLGS